MSTKAVASCDCGYRSPPTTPALAAYGLRKHSCTTTAERTARSQRRLDKLAASGPPMPCTHKQVTHTHGTHACYVLDRCRCRPCRDANSADTAARKRAQAYGRWDNLVDAGPARAHIRALMAQGMGLKRIVAVSCCSQGQLWMLIYGKRRHGRKNGRRTPSRRITKTVNQRILAITVDLAPGAKVPATGSRRRLQALVATGWSMAKLATALGLLPSNFGHVIHDGPGTLRVATVKAVADLYDQLWDTPPAHAQWREKIAYNRALAYAATHGWVGPMAWDDDDIDDPDATAEVQVQPRPQKVSLEDVEWLLDQEPFALTQIAARLGVVRSSVEHACARGGRRDLLSRMARNAVVQDLGRTVAS